MDAQHEELEEIREKFGNNEYPFIAVENVVRDFEIGEFIVRAVDGASLQINEHEYVAIVGASGAGKTTLLHLIGGLDKVTKGRIILSQVDITPMEPESLALFRIFNIGLVFQNANLISSLSAIENVMFPIQLTGLKFKECQDRALKLLTFVGLKERIEHLPFQLSAGEQQRVAIARALANSPPVIIADEPTANLDNRNADYIARLFEGLRKAGKTIIVATHEANLINQAHRIIKMDDGKIIEDTPVRSIEFEENNQSEDEIRSFAFRL